MFSPIVFDVCSQQVRLSLCLGRQALETLQQTKIAAACIHSSARTDQQHPGVVVQQTQPDLNFYASWTGHHVRYPAFLAASNDLLLGAISEHGHVWSCWQRTCSCEQQGRGYSQLCIHGNWQ